MKAKARREEGRFLDRHDNVEEEEDHVDTCRIVTIDGEQPFPCSKCYSALASAENKYVLPNKNRMICAALAEPGEQCEKGREMRTQFGTHNRGAEWDTSPIQMHQPVAIWVENQRRIHARSCRKSQLETLWSVQ